METDMKTQISNALKELLKENKPGKRITVQDLTAKCGISRQTFYYHFDSIDAAMQWKIHYEMQLIISASHQERSMYGKLLVFVQNVSRGYDLQDKLGHMSPGDSIYNIMKESYREYLLGIFHDLIPHTAITYDEMNAALDFYAGGVMTLLDSNYRSQHRMSDEILTERIVQLIHGTMIDFSGA